MAVGLLTASELALAGVRTCIVERLNEPSPFSKALTLHPRSIEILEMRGLGERFKEIGKPLGSGHFAGEKIKSRSSHKSMDKLHAFFISFCYISNKITEYS
ncbi:hypothetical protein DT075_23000 [Bacillus licheniformis]|nr:hypothetical protein DT075_23000 [Bacillus licheniformis]